MRYAIDTETSPFDPTKKQTNAWALEPYRKEFGVKLMCLVSSDGYSSVTDNPADSMAALLTMEEDPIVYCHNSIFDISVLIRHIGYDAINHIRWRDTGLLAKYLLNSQRDEHFRYSLRNCVEKWLSDHPQCDEFLNVKDNMENDPDYWLNRVILDTEMTLSLAERLESLLPVEQVSAYINECRCLLPMARGYMQGVNIDEDVVEEIRITYQSEVSRNIRELGITESVMSSPKQLSHLLFSKWGLNPAGDTPSGAPSTSAENLKLILLESEDTRLTKLMAAKTAKTILTKYANGYKKMFEYIGQWTMHSAPRLYNSYTGRMTYSSKMMKKYQVGIALQQLPRKAKLVKKAMVAPPGFKFVYADFAAQELRLMAQMSKDPVMLQAFNEGKDLHSIMTEGIYGTPYDEIVEGNKNGIEEIKDQRNSGKLTNLSCMYRIGAPSLKKKFFADYDITITAREAAHYVNTYKRTYRGVERYWQDAIRTPRQKGYAETLFGRRFGIHKFDWQGESSAINMPIQGGGVDLAEIVIGEVAEAFPDITFVLAVHDSLTWQVPEDFDEYALQSFVNDINYNQFANQELLLDFPMDFEVGTNLGEMRPL